MDRWKSRGGKSQGREEKSRKDQRRERVRRKKMQVRKKVAKSRNTALFFQWFVAPEGRKVGSLKQRVRSQIKDDKLHAVLARSTFRSQNGAKHTRFGALLEVEMSKKCTPLWREAHLEVKMYKAHHARTTFGNWDVETPLWREAHLEVKSGKDWEVWSTFGRSSVLLRGRHNGLCTFTTTPHHYTTLHYATLHYTTLH